MPPAKNKKQLQNVANNTTDKFNEVHARNIEAAKKIIEANYVDSESEDELELDEKTILDSLYKHYDKTVDEIALAKTSGFLENVLHSGAATCLICIASIKRADAIWSCKYCYCFFHLNCICRWSKDSMAQFKARTQNDQPGYYNHMGEYIPPKKSKALHWCCPQCRKEFSPEEKPTTYECFCGRETNPPSQPWLIPHSCGEICGKALQPNCGHKCTLLCHPGPCPPCAQYAITSCKCGKSKPKSVRCIDKQWECQKTCDRLLKCGEHVCGRTCHKADQCPPCNQTSKQPCECGRETTERQCWDLEWHCKNVCMRTYSCGLHVCKKVCHSGDCGECPLSLPRSCPCGKSKKIGPCSELIETCGDTCQKLLPCGLHNCTQRCHKGNCNLCLVTIKKKCRCGMHEKELPCSKEFTCETKCKQTKDCEKHPCNRKCCDKNCPPCDKVCGKPLSCGKHKCQSVCHKGPCYPCQQQSQIHCRCGKTKKSVPCGRERTARIVCLEPCRIPSKCHHTNKHRCHKNECPPCSQPCGLLNDISKCGHVCTAKCHASVKVKKSSANTASVWEPTKQFEFKTMPHPRCEQKVSVTCIGGHEIADWPCWNSKPSSCQRLCNRQLKCGNHKCNRICHSVPDLKDMNQQDGCAPCDRGCDIPRPKGCIHHCPRPCHVPPCYPCSVAIKTKCHCGLMPIVYKCSDYYSNEGTDNDEAERQENLKSCGNRCLKNYPCGHRCTAKCHSGPCPYPEACRKKLRIFCDCKRLKSEISCDKHRSSGVTKLQCDENCVETKKNLELARKREQELLRQQEEERNRLEVEQFEKKFTKRKPKERKMTEVPQKKPINWKLVGVYAGIFAVILLAVALAFYEDH